MCERERSLFRSFLLILGKTFDFGVLFPNFGGKFMTYGKRKNCRINQ